MSPPTRRRAEWCRDRAKVVSIEPRIMAEFPHRAWLTTSRVVFLGGLGEIGRNCAVIEHDRRLLILDCGVMFPDREMPGGRLGPSRFFLPTTARARDRRRGHHPRPRGPRRRTELSVARDRVADLRIRAVACAGPTAYRRSRSLSKTSFISVHDGERRNIGPFDVEFIPVTHSIPHGFATAFHTPQA